MRKAIKRSSPDKAGNEFTAHDSALEHVSGEAIFINDMDARKNSLYGHIVYSPFASADILSIDTKEAWKVEGVKLILSAADIPAQNQMGPVVKDELCLAEGECTFIGQAILLIAAKSKKAALLAERKVRIEYKEKHAVTSLEESIAKGMLLSETATLSSGDVEKSLPDCDHVLEGKVMSGPQEHWYLETQSCLAVPVERKALKVYSSTQHPAETQTIISGILGIPRNAISVEVKRVGGAFGGKETQANHVAAWACLLAWKSNMPVKVHLDRDTDQIITGKRHPFLSKYKIGFTKDGLIKAFDVELNADAGSSTDLTRAIMERAVFHVDNAYFIPNLRVRGFAWKTNKPSNTAFRGFGAPQGMLVIEEAIDRIARFLDMDPAVVRKQNFYGEDNNNITHYGEQVENNRLHRMWNELMLSSGYNNKKEAIREFNAGSTYMKRGIAMTPVKFGISFTTQFLNQAGALVNIYSDGSVLINHGGIEMGQGLHTKIRKIAALELGISESRIRISPTCTDVVPNTSATAASSGTDMNGMAVKDACRKLHARLSGLLERNEQINDSNFTELVNRAWRERISLSATGFYKTPGIHFDRVKGQGRPFHYFAFGMAVSIIELDTLTGYVKLLSTDILHDAGDSLHPEVDMGQVRGGFIQGLGWCTTEDMHYSSDGHLLNHSPDTYKIPTAMDIPENFVVNFLQNAPNPNTIRKSKAVGEPPFMLSFSVWLAIKDAISAVADHKKEPDYSLPATNEVILQSIKKIKKQ